VAGRTAQRISVALAFFCALGLLAGCGSSDSHGAQLPSRAGVEFTSAGAEVQVGGSETLVGVAGFGRGSSLTAVGPVATRTSGGEVVYAVRPGVREWFANRRRGLEQGFDIARRPGGSGPLRVSIALSAGVRPWVGERNAALLWLQHGAVLQYSGVSALDARGRRLPAWLQVRHGRLSLLVDDRGAQYPVRIDPFVEQTKLVPTASGDSDGQAGYSVAISSNGTTALVGGYHNNTGAGATWVFLLSGGVWTQQAELIGTGAIAPSKGLGSEQGFSVALSSDGDTALIGAPHDNGGPGAAWVFTRTGTDWTQQQELTAPSDELGDSGFGYSVALSSQGTTALIGGPHDEGLSASPVSDYGAAWVYALSNNSWGEVTKLVPALENDTYGGGEFGTSVSLSGDGTIALIGEPDDDAPEGSSIAPGQAWIYDYSGTSWSEDSQLRGMDESGDPDFGFSVALAGNGESALIGGPYDNGGAGAAWSYDNDGRWIDEQKITASDETSGDTSQFGSSVSLSDDGEEGLIGGPQDGGGAGAAWLYTNSGTTTFSEAQKLTVSDESTGDDSALGTSVALSGDRSTAVAGGPSDGTTGAGAAWTFGAPLPTATTTSISANVNPAVVAQTVTYTATVSPAPDGGTVDITGCGSEPISNGQATCQTSYPTLGNYNVTATYSGDTNFLGSSSSALSETVNQAPTTTSVTSSTSSPKAGTPITFTATVKPAPDLGTVDFTDDTRPIANCGSVEPNAQGVATCTYTFTTGGDQFIYATYSGSDNYGGSTGAAFVQMPPAYDNTTIGVSLAQAAGDPAQTGPSGSALSYSGVPLVAGRATLVRVFVDPVGLAVPGSDGLTATLTGTANGKPLSGSPLQADTGGPEQRSDQSLDQQLGEDNTSFNFVLPSSWTTGTVSLTATVSQPAQFPSDDEQCVEPSPCKLSLTLNSVTFTQMPPFEVTPIELTWVDPEGNVVAPAEDPQSAMALAYELMPVQTIVNEGYQGTIDESALENDPGGAGGDQADLDGLNLVYNWTANRFDADCCSNTGDMHDMVVGFNYSLARGDTYINNEIGTIDQGKTPVDNVFEPDAIVDSGYDVPVAHEMGHAVGRLHADHGCGGPAGGGSDPDWPDYDGHLEPTPNLANGVAPSSQTAAEGESYGVNLAWRVPESSGTGPFVIFPDTDYDIMSYCGNEWEANPSASDPGEEWTSARGWSQEFTCLQEQPNPNCPVNEQQSSQGEVKTSVRFTGRMAHDAGGRLGRGDQRPLGLVHWLHRPGRRAGRAFADARHPRIQRVVELAVLGDLDEHQGRCCRHRAARVRIGAHRSRPRPSGRGVHGRTRLRPDPRRVDRRARDQVGRQGDRADPRAADRAARDRVEAQAEHARPYPDRALEQPRSQQGEAARVHLLQQRRTALHSGVGGLRSRAGVDSAGAAR
jgi:Bacterial Ig-like domain (group 3)/FG-GAP repeat